MRYVIFTSLIIVLLISGCVLIDGGLTIKVYIKTFKDFELSPNILNYIYYTEDIDKSTINVLIECAKCDLSDVDAVLKIGYADYDPSSVNPESGKVLITFKKMGDQWLGNVEDSFGVGRFKIEIKISGRTIERIYRYKFKKLPEIILLKPKKGEIVEKEKVVFEWEWEEEITMNFNYNIRIGVESPDELYPINHESSDNKHFVGNIAKNFEGNMMYRWYISAVDENTKQVITRSNISYFYTTNSPPIVNWISPSNGSEVHDFNFKFEVIDEDEEANNKGAIEYRLSYGVNGNEHEKSGVVIFPKNSTRTVVSLEPEMFEKGNYTWKLIITDHSATGSDIVISKQGNFTLVNNPPATPFDLQPSGKVYSVESYTTVELSWKGNDPDEDELFYTVRFGENPDYLSNPVILENSTRTSVETPQIEIGKTYYWAVKAQDRYGDSSDWAFAKFKVVNASEITPRKLDPKDGSIFNIPRGTKSRIVEFKWEPVDLDDPTYVLTIEKDGKTMKYETKQTTYELDLEAGEYHWNVNVKGYISGSSPFKFIINRLPSAPEPQYPERDSLTGFNVNFRWKPSYDEDGDIVKYKLFLSAYKDDVEDLRSSALRRSGIMSSECFIQINGDDPEYLYDNTKFYWRVVAVDYRDGKELGSSAGSISYFTTKDVNDPPGKPDDEYPVRDSKNTPVYLTLSWKNFDEEGDLLTSKIYFGDSSECVSLKKDECLLGTLKDQPPGEMSFEIPYKLEYFKRYYWKVVVSDDQYTTEGPLWWFTTENAEPPTVKVLHPNNESVSDPSNVRLSWYVEDNRELIKTYRIYFSKTSSFSYPYVEVRARDLNCQNAFGGITCGITLDLSYLYWESIYWYWKIEAVNENDLSGYDIGYFWFQ